jgi:hypothetical protein
MQSTFLSSIRDMGAFSAFVGPLIEMKSKDRAKRAFARKASAIGSANIKAGGANDSSWGK